MLQHLPSSVLLNLQAFLLDGQMVHHEDILRHHSCSGISSNYHINISIHEGQAYVFFNWISRGSSNLLEDLRSLVLKDLAFIIFITYFYNLWTYGHGVKDLSSKAPTDPFLWHPAWTQEEAHELRTWNSSLVCFNVSLFLTALLYSILIPVRILL